MSHQEDGSFHGDCPIYTHSQPYLQPLSHQCSKEKKEKIFPRAWRDQPIDRAGSHGHPSTSKSRPKRRVEPSGETKLPIALNLQDPFFRLTGCHPRQTGGILSSLFPKGTITAHYASNVPSGN